MAAIILLEECTGLRSITTCRWSRSWMIPITTTATLKRTGVAAVVCDKNCTALVEVLKPMQVPLNDYRLGVRLGLQQLHADNAELEKVDIIISYRNEDYAMFECLSRFLFVMVSILSVSTYLMKLSEIPRKQWSLIQRWILTMSLMLVLFNDPLHVLLVLAPTHAFVLKAVSLVVKAVFYSLLLLFWLVVFATIAEPGGSVVRPSVCTWTWKGLFGVFLATTTATVFLTRLWLDVQVEVSETHHLEAVMASAQVALAVLLVCFCIWFVAVFCKATRVIRRLPSRMKVLY
eukprot:Filipodium_phascolosomae@DN5307_c0_g1_i1.p1